MSEPYALLIAVLGAYGLATMVADYDGPFGVFLKLRSGKLKSLFECNVCLLPYFALIPVLGLGLGLYGYLATIGGGIILARLT